MWFCRIMHQKIHVSYEVGYVIFNLHVQVGNSVLCQVKGVGHMFSNHPIFKCFGPPALLLFDDQSLHTGDDEKEAEKAQVSPVSSTLPK